MLLGGVAVLSVFYHLPRDLPCSNAVVITDWTMIMPQSLPFYTITEAAKVIGLTPSRLRQMLGTGDLEGMKAGPRAWLIPKKEVERLKKLPQTVGRPRVGRQS